MTAAGLLKTASETSSTVKLQHQQQKEQHIPPAAPAQPSDRSASHLGHPIIDFLLAHNRKQSALCVQFISAITVVQMLTALADTRRLMLKARACSTRHSIPLRFSL
jgi:hypothetical protein